MILSIESSCDESAIALFSEEEGFISELISTQIEAHREFGGVVPGIATREHLKNFPYLLEEAFEKVGKRINDIEKIVVTQGPGLAGCLALGISLAKALSLALKKPVYGANHLLAHALSPFVPLFEEDHAVFRDVLVKQLPHLGLLVSGGNTLLFSIEKDFSIKILGETLDDAAGEALDKGAKLLGLSYPGGPEIEKLAKSGDASKFSFPKAFSETKELKFSFSGLKTSLRYFLEKQDPAFVGKERPSICASYQKAVVDALAFKAKQALTLHKFKSIGLSGGVSNNQLLRKTFQALAEKYGIPAYFPFSKHTGDNASMVAFAAYLAPQKLTPGQKLTFSPTLKLQ